MTTQASTAKTSADPSAVLRFLQSELDSEITSLSPIMGGEHSQAFSFTSKKGEFVARVDKIDKAFKKDLYAFKQFRSQHLPIPEILRLAKLSETLFVCISEKAEGIHLSRVSKENISSLTPRVLEIFDALEDTPLPRRNDFGPFDENGVARFSSWKESLLSIESNPDYPWHDWFQSTCLEYKLYKELISRLKKEVGYLPELRLLVHGDIGMDNVLVDKEKITAVLDWGASRYGDPLFDVAWLNLWWKQQPVTMLYQEHAAKRKRDLSNFDARIRWYTTWIGLTSLSFFAKSSQVKSYQWLKNRLGELGLL